MLVLVFAVRQNDLWAFQSFAAEETGYKPAEC